MAGIYVLYVDFIGTVFTDQFFFHCAMSHIEVEFCWWLWNDHHRWANSNSGNVPHQEPIPRTDVETISMWNFSINYTISYRKLDSKLFTYGFSDCYELKFISALNFKKVLVNEFFSHCLLFRRIAFTHTQKTMQINFHKRNYTEIELFLCFNNLW